MKAPDPKTKPLKIQRLPELRTLRIEWADGYTCEMSYEYLRKCCPCATCNHTRSEARDGLRVVTEGPPPSELQIQEISLVGTYAVNFLWSDGHNTGIYSFRLLRELCPHEGEGPDAVRLETL